MALDHHELQFLIRLTSTPSAPGRESAVIRAIEEWIVAHPVLRAERDRWGNLLVHRTQGTADAPTLFLGAHVDHPGFIVDAVTSSGELTLTYRGVADPALFEGAPIEIWAANQRVNALVTRARLVEDSMLCATAMVQPPSLADEVVPGDLARWRLDDAYISDGRLHAHACDDLVGVAASLFALATPVPAGGPPLPGPITLMLTRAEEVGLLGALAICRDGALPVGAQVVCVDVSPIRGNTGVIVAGGDQMAFFSRKMTRKLLKLVNQETPELLADGGCEAALYTQFGYEAGCLVIPIEGYHNQGESGVMLESVLLADVEALKDVLVRAIRELPREGTLRQELDGLWERRGGVLGE